MSILEVNNISFAYPGKPMVIEQLSLTVKSGERVALQAPSGFGKTTLCKLITGYLKPSSGSILLDGHAFAASKGNANPVQLIGQHPQQLIDPLIRVCASLEEAAALQPDVLEALGIQKAWLNRYPHELSGGELQRICIARTLSLQPRFLIADEISTMLDAITQVRIWEVLVRYCEEHDAGLLFVTHSCALQDRLATRVCKLAEAYL